MSSNETNQLLTFIQSETDANYDAIWILISAFIIFTMQSGFGLLEAGTISRKSETNVMIKNVADILFGGLSYWMFGYAFAFGEEDGSNAFLGIGNFFTMLNGEAIGPLYAKFFFQLSFATTATTIVSGAMVERVYMKSYMLFSFVNILAYCFPAHWVWGSNGWLYEQGVIDIAGCGPVHMVGGAAALVATIYLGPRRGRFDPNQPPQSMSNPTNVILGTFFLWWGWLGFNCGSTFGMSQGKWRLASRAAVVTIMGAIGGGLFSVFYCYVIRFKAYKQKLDVATLSSGVLAGLVSVTAICAVCKPWEGLVIGIIGGAITIGGVDLLTLLKVDDPVGVVPVHLFGGFWGLIAVAFFVEKDELGGFSPQYGIFQGGNAEILGWQLLAGISITAWAMVIAFIELIIIDKLFGFRMSAEEEALGADFVEHGIADSFYGTTSAGPVLKVKSGSHILSDFNTSTISIQQPQQNNNGNLAPPQLRST